MVKKLYLCIYLKEPEFLVYIATHLKFNFLILSNGRCEVMPF